MSRGFRFAQDGVPLRRASDYQKVIDTRWKFLEIAHEIEVDITYSAWSAGFHPIELFKHNLNFLPAWEFYPDESVLGNTTMLAGSGIEAWTEADTKRIVSNLVWQVSDSSAPIRIKGVLRVYTVDFTKEYKAPSEVVPGGLSSESVAGFRFIDKNQRGARMGDREIHKYTATTKAKQISIHQHGTVVANAGNSFKPVITHNIGYPATYLIVRIDPNDSVSPSSIFYNVQTVGPISANIGRAAANANTLTFSGAQSALDGVYGYIILKDPVEIAS